MHDGVNSSIVAHSEVPKSNLAGLHSLQGAVKGGMDGSDLFKELLQAAKAVGPLNSETFSSTGSSCDEGVSDLTSVDADKKTDTPEEIPTKVAVCDKDPSALVPSIDSVPAIPEVPDASLVKANVLRSLPKHVGDDKFSIPASNKSKHAKKSGPVEEQAEATTVAGNSPLVAVSNTGADTPIVAVHQSIPLSRVTLHVERNDANASKATPVAIPVGNAKELRPPSISMATGTSDKSPDFVPPRSREPGVEVETETHDVEPVPLVTTHPMSAATVSIPMSDAATFRPFLFRNDQHSEVVIRPENDMPSVRPELPIQASTAQPIERLELQWNDFALGKVSLTAELRDGALHAVVDSSRAVSSVDATDLHRFLEDNHVPLHALQVNGQPTASQISRDSSWNSAATDVGTGMGGSQSFSHRGQEQEGSSAGEQRRTHSKTERYEGAVRTVEGSTAIPRRQDDQRLSIHI